LFQRSQKLGLLHTTGNFVTVENNMNTITLKYSKKIKYQMKPELEKLLGKVEEDIKNNRNIVGPFKTAKEADEYLDSQ